MHNFAALPEPPYYAVIFSSLRTEIDDRQYAAMGERMLELAAQQPGYLGVETVRGTDRFGMTVSYWESTEAIRLWREHAQHHLAQQQGRERWYKAYKIRIAHVEQAYSFGS